jgi:hypothetical protein
MRISGRKDNFLNYFKNKYLTFYEMPSGVFRAGQLTSASLLHLYYYCLSEEKKWKRPHRKKTEQI